MSVEMGESHCGVILQVPALRERVARRGGGCGVEGGNALVAGSGQPPVGWV